MLAASGRWSHRGGLVAAALRYSESQSLVVIVVVILLLLAVGVSEVGAQSDAAPASPPGVLKGGVLNSIFI